ncbi:MAG: YwaF family protein, partial [Clostridia bacterium]|nr:YwaF family protein [Clostridia bacterium]
MTVEYGSFFYFLYPLLQVLIVIELYFLLRKRSKKAVYWILFAFFAFNFALHFLKVFFYPYNDPGKYSESDIIFTLSPSNICALNVIIFPFLYLTKRPALKVYMFYVGIISGFAAVWLPSMGDFDTSNAIAFDTFRFYTCHGILWMTPLLMVLLGVHKLNYRRIWITPVIYIIVLSLVLVNNYSMYCLGYSKSVSNNGFAVKPPDS